MHVYEEDAECRSDSVIECLSWMRCVDTADQRHFLHANQNANQTGQLDPVAAADPDADPDTNNNHGQAALAAAFGDDPHESTLRRAYQQASFDYGWLACGNARCIVSITQTQLVSTRTNEPCPSGTGEECARLARLGTNTNANANATANANAASDAPDAARTNFNLWGHKHKVIHVRWNEPYQKLASCSQNGVIFVWVKHDGRWSVELINDRNQQVSDFRWSYDGRLALITYADGFVLVGNVNGQRHWSTLLPLRTGAASTDTQQSNGGDNAASAAGAPPSPNGANAEPVRLTCGIWTPRNKRVLFGTSAGRLLVVSAQTGHIVADYPVRGTRFGIVQLEWNCAAWHLVDELHSAHSSTARSAANTDQHVSPLLRPAAADMATAAAGGNDRDSAHDDADGYTLACALSNGDILLLRNADPEETVRTIETRLERVRMAFSRGGSLLAVCGRVAEPAAGTGVERRPTSASCEQSEPGDSVLRFYSAAGELVRSYTLLRRGARKRSIDDEEDASRRANAVCWAHDDARVFVACGCHVRTFWIRMAMSPLAALTCIAIRRAIGSRRAVTRLPLPGALQRSVDHYFAATIRSRSRLPTARSLREFVCSPPASRLFCTMKRVAGGAHVRHGAVEADLGPNGEPKTPGAAADSASLSPDVCYVLYLEFLGGLIPLLKAKRSSRFRLDFVVFDPLADVCSEPVATDTCQPASRAYCTECQRLRSQQRTATSASSGPSHSLPVGTDQRDPLLSRLATSGGESSLPSYDESALRENSPLAAVVANLWGTKFRVCGLQPFVPKALGTVQYKPSLFHLQPRKMTVTVAELNVDTLAQQLARRSARLAERVRTSARHLVIRPGSTNTPNELQPLADCRSALRPASDSTVSDLLHLDAPATTADAANLLRADNELDEFEQVVACATDAEGVDFARMKMIDLDGGCLMHEAAATRFGAAPDDDDDDEDVAMYIDECITVDVTDVDLRRREQLAQLRGNTAVGVTPTWLRRQPFGGDSNRPVVDSFAERCGSPSRCLVAPIAPSETLGSLASTSASPGFLLDATSRNAERPPAASNACACAGQRQCAACAGAVVQTANELVRQPSGKERASLLRRLMRRGGSNTPSTTKWIESTPVHGAVSSDTTATRWLNAPPRSAGATTSRSAPATPTHSATTQIRLTDVNASARGAASSSTNCGTSQRRTTGQKQDESVAWRLASLLTPKLVRRRRCHSQQVAANAHLTALCTPRVGTKARLAKRASLERCVACGRSLPKPSPHRGAVAVESDEYRSVNTDGSIDETLHRDESSQTGRKSLCESATSRSRSNKLGRKSKVHDGAQPSVTDASEAQRVHVMHNKEPIWNELSQVYQLDFGGRVTQESAKNFQIEFNGEQVLQFGRIGNDSFTLDFQHPFSPIQAFGVALANITQRLK